MDSDWSAAMPAGPADPLARNIGAIGCGLQRGWRQFLPGGELTQLRTPVKVWVGQT